MTRPLRLEFPGALFHITARGNAKRPIFLDDLDRERFIELLGRCTSRCDWILTAYALMLNHVHLVIQLQRETLSKGMQWLIGSYSQIFNRRHESAGHVFQGRFKAFLIEKEAHYLEVLRYVVLNPVRANLVSAPDDYRWSSHRAVLEVEPPPHWLAVDDVLAQFAADRDVARNRYRTFVDAGIGGQSPWRDLVAQAYLGTSQWIDGVREKIELKPRANEHAAALRAGLMFTMSDIVFAVARAFAVGEERVREGTGLPRLIAAWIGWNIALLTNPQIAAGLRLRSASYVSHLVRDCDRQIDTNPAVQRWIERAESTLRGKNSRSQI